MVKMDYIIISKIVIRHLATMLLMHAALLLCSQTTTEINPISAQVQQQEELVGNTAADQAQVQQQEELVENSAAGRNEKIHSLLESGLYVDETNSSSTTPLLAAINEGHASTVKLLLDANANPEKVGLISQEPFSPLLAATAKGHKEITQMLIDAGANIDNALLKAASSGNEQATRELLDRGANADYRSTFSAFGGGGDKIQTPLLAAIQSGHPKIVQVLLGEYGANPDQTDENGRSPLEHAAERGYTLIVKMLLERGAHIPQELFRQLSHHYNPRIRAIITQHAPLVEQRAEVITRSLEEKPEMPREITRLIERFSNVLEAPPPASPSQVE